MTPAAVVRPVELVLTGPGGRTARLDDGSGRGPVATITSTVPDLVLWSTRRQSWRDLDVRVTGDEAAAAHFCDEVHVF
jgi:hypothetical protein